MDFVSQQYWDESYADSTFTRPPADDFLRLSLLKYIPSTTAGTAFEVGCYPGGYLTVLGDLGYKLSGIDLTPKTELLQAQLSDAGYLTGEIRSADFMKFKTSEKYQVVTSFGFIEHFEAYKEVILRQAGLVDNNGYIVISAPNFRGFFQQTFHRIFDTKNLRRHNLKSMNPEEWSRLLQQADFEILFAGYGGGAVFWMTSDNSRLQHFVGRSFLFLQKWLGRVFRFRYATWNHRAIACDCLVVARKI